MAPIRRLLGRTGLSIHPLVFGTLPMGPLQAGLAPREGGRLIRHALERGLNLIDTAELYGSYGHIRAGLEGFRGEVLLATKTHAPTAALARAHVERALRELGVDCLDIVHVHGARLTDPFAERGEVFEALLVLKAEGKVRCVGVSGHRVAAIRRAAEHPDVDVIHPLINREGLGIPDGAAEEMAAAIAAAGAAGKGVYAMKALAGGNFIATARESLRYVLGLSGVHGVAVGMLSEAEIDANLGLFEGAADGSAWGVLEGRSRKIRVMELFCKGCGACAEACASDAITVVDGVARVDAASCVLCGYCAAACPEFMIRVV
ncbi:MAG: aldo/keto reductase [Deltaproteobacteria bacterium]|nr:aldo/keto reductase [Deltaproteobacteria bacterium]